MHVNNLLIYRIIFFNSPSEFCLSLWSSGRPSFQFQNSPLFRERSSAIAYWSAVQSGVKCGRATRGPVSQNCYLSMLNIEWTRRKRCRRLPRYGARLKGQNGREIIIGTFTWVSRGSISEFSLFFRSVVRKGIYQDKLWCRPTDSWFTDSEIGSRNGLKRSIRIMIKRCMIRTAKFEWI